MHIYVCTYTNATAASDAAIHSTREAPSDPENPIPFGSYLNAHEGGSCRRSSSLARVKVHDIALSALRVKE